jgi:indolepyruvate ferredoxin oxidoreductase, beta subunit
VKTLMKDPFNLTITGVGGQGNVVISQILGEALVAQGYRVVVSETYGTSQRGGDVTSHIRISKDTQYSPLPGIGSADIILGMEPLETFRTLGKFGSPKVTTIVNPKPIYPQSVLIGQAKYPDIDALLDAIKKLSAKMWLINAVDVAKELGNGRAANMVLIGALLGSGVVPLDRSSIEPLIRQYFPKAVDINLKALDKGAALTAS